VEQIATDALAAWESEGGAHTHSGSPLITEGKARLSLVPPRIKPTAAVEKIMSGTLNQIEWAEQIKARVSGEFDRVANAMKAAAGRQVEQDRTETEAMIAILEEKRAEVLAKDQAGYFIHDWQELDDQVRQMIVQDPRYKAIRTKQVERRRALTLQEPL
jgi:uncharacterized protein with von Willebrand factor type A (vWA) domain